MAKVGRSGSRRRSRGEWQELIEQWHRSAQSIGVFCAERDLRVSTFSWWRWRLGSDQASDSAARSAGFRSDHPGSPSVGSGGVATAGFTVAWELSGGAAWSQVATFVVFLAGLAALYQLWMPRILRRRHEAERIEDPEKARRARLRERRWAAIGWTLGIVSGTAGLIAGLVLGP